MKKKAVALCTLIVLFSWSGGVLADSADSLGFSSRGTAMGGAMVGIAEGWEAMYYNSSALALSRNSSSINISMIGGGLKQNGENNLGTGNVFKYAINHRFLRDRVGVGLSVGTASSSGGISLDIGSLLGGGSGGGWQRYEDSSPLLLNFGLGFRITDWLAVGVYGSRQTQLISAGYIPIVVDPFLEMLLGISTGVIPSNIKGYNFDAGAEPDSEYVYSFSVTLRPIKYISLGYQYIPQTWSRQKLRVELVGGAGSILPETQFILIDMKTPANVETTQIGGAANIPIPWNDGTLTIAYTHETQNWDGVYPSSIQYQWDTNDTFNPEWFSDKLPRDPKLKDVSFDRYGFEYTGDASPMMFWKLKELSNPRFAVRGGYYHWNSPQPDPRYSWQLVMLDSDADVYSFGLGFGYDRKNRARPGVAVPPRLEVDLHYQVTNLEDRDYHLHQQEFGQIELERYLIRTEGSISYYGVQVTWLQ